MDKFIISEDEDTFSDDDAFGETSSESKESEIDHSESLQAQALLAKTGGSTKPDVRPIKMGNSIKSEDEDPFSDDDAFGETSSESEESEMDQSESLQAQVMLAKNGGSTEPDVRPIKMGNSIKSEDEDPYSDDDAFGETSSESRESEMYYSGSLQSQAMLAKNGDSTEPDVQPIKMDSSFSEDDAFGETSSESEKSEIDQSGSLQIEAMLAKAGGSTKPDVRPIKKGNYIKSEDEDPYSDDDDFGETSPESEEYEVDHSGLLQIQALLAKNGDSTEPDVRPIKMKKSIKSEDEDPFSDDDAFDETSSESEESEMDQSGSLQQQAMPAKNCGSTKPYVRPKKGKFY
ncbi:uncharacterized protein [Drosophila suzukii]|uniref:Uncharacterized protein n=1 Tax=Drosophila suzukii TaxID=28584 RepID=A0ABM4TRW5_DROSZ